MTTTLTLETVADLTTDMIDALRTEAVTAGDDVMVALCDLAVDGLDGLYSEQVDLLADEEYTLTALAGRMAVMTAINDARAQV